MPGNPHIPIDNATIACALNELGLQKVPDVIARGFAKSRPAAHGPAAQWSFHIIIRHVI